MWDMHLPARTHSSIYTKVLSQIVSVHCQERLYKPQADYTRSFGLRERKETILEGIRVPSTDGQLKKKREGRKERRDGLTLT